LVGSHAKVPSGCNLRAVFGNKRKEEAEASLKALVFDIAGTVVDEAVQRALPPGGAATGIKWREGMLMDVALGLVAAQIGITMLNKRMATALGKLPDWVIEANTPRVGKPTAERNGKLVLSVMARGAHLAVRRPEAPAEWEMPLEYFVEVAQLFEGFGFDVEQLALSFVLSMRDVRLSLSSLALA